MSDNPSDLYSFFFTVHFEDGEMLEVSTEDSECDGDAEHSAHLQVSHTYDDAIDIEYHGYERNYP
jgi:TusA-related sulfurtransferase